MKYLILYTLFLQFILPIFGNTIYFVDYTSSSKYTSILIDGKKYRETSIPPFYNGKIAFNLEKDNYNFKLSDVDLKQELHLQKFHNFNRLMDGRHKLNDLVISNSTLVQFEYYAEYKHTFYYVYQNIYKKFDWVTDPIVFEVYIDGKLIERSKNFKGFSTFNSVILDKGVHNLLITSTSNDFWCSCPSSGNGFQNGRYFYAWSVDVYDQLKTLSYNDTVAELETTAIEIIQIKYIKPEPILYKSLQIIVK